MSGKHSIENKFNIKKYLIIFFTIIFIILAIFLIYNKYKNINSTDAFTSASENNSETKNNLSLNLIELNAESEISNYNNLISSGIKIQSKEDNSYKISSSIKNTATVPQEKCNINLKLYNSEKEEITSIDFLIDAILPDSKTTLLTISTLDLSDCSYYVLAAE